MATLALLTPVESRQGSQLLVLYLRPTGACALPRNPPLSAWRYSSLRSLPAEKRTSSDTVWSASAVEYLPRATSNASCSRPSRLQCLLAQRGRRVLQLLRSRPLGLQGDQIQFAPSSLWRLQRWQWQQGRRYPPQLLYWIVLMGTLCTLYSKELTSRRRCGLHPALPVAVWLIALRSKGYLPSLALRQAVLAVVSEGKDAAVATSIDSGDISDSAGEGERNRHRPVTMYR